MSILVLFQLVYEWSMARNIINGSSAADQFVKLTSEFSNELAEAIYEIWSYHGNDPWERHAIISTKLADAVGDSLVVLTNIAAQMGMDIKDIYNTQNFPVYTQVPHAGLLVASMGQGRLADAIKKNNKEDAYAAIGVMLYGLDLVCKEYQIEPKNCLSDAYDQIKNRTGVMYNGIFVKSDDANYERIVEELAFNDSTASHGLHDFA